MANPIIMPRQGQTVESCIVSEWHKKVGDEVKKGDKLFTYETDKSTFEELSEFEGTLLAIFYEEGDDVEVLKNMCVIGKEGESFAEFAPEGDEEAIAVVESKEETKIETPVITKNDSEKIKISPRARNLAAKKHVPIDAVSPTGPYGRIIERDIKTALDNGLAMTKPAFDKIGDNYDIEGTGIGGRITTADLNRTRTAVTDGPDYVDTKLSPVRKAISKAMTNSLTSMAQLTLNSSFDATSIMEYRKQIKANQEKLGLNNITLNDMVMFAVSRVLLDYEDLNANLIDDTMRRFSNVHLGMAVDTERGLLVPTIRNANKLSLNELAGTSKGLAKQAQSGNIAPDDLSGGTFTVTSLGALGIESFTPVINPPQTAILGVCNIEYKIKKEGSEFVQYPAMGLSITFDHRAIDGAPCARFLKDLCNALENFNLLLSKN